MRSVSNGSYLSRETDTRLSAIGPMYLIAARVDGTGHLPQRKHWLAGKGTAYSFTLRPAR